MLGRAQATGLAGGHHVWFDATHYSGIAKLPRIVGDMTKRICASTSPAEAGH